MNHRKTLYGYQIRDGEIAVVEEEAILVRRVFSLYTGGLSYQKISDLLNREEVPYSQEAPAWNKHKVKRLLENPRYTGQDGYPAIIDKVGFEETQSHIHEKTAGYAPKTERPVLRLKRYLRSAAPLCVGWLEKITERTRCTSSVVNAVLWSPFRMKCCWRMSHIR